MESFSHNMELKAAGMLVREQLTLFQEFISGDRDGFVWTNMLMPPELIYGGGMIPIQTELIAGWLASLKLSHACIQKAHKMGFSGSLCSYHKAVIGALEEGLLPPPEIAVFSSQLCDGGSMMARYLQQRFQTRALVLNVPYGSVGKTGVEKLKCDIASALEFLERHGNRMASKQNLESVLKLSNLGRSLLRSANKIRSVKYSFEGYLALRNMYGASFLMGSRQGVEIARTYYHELRKKEEKSHGAPRILWIHFAPLYDSELMHMFETDLGMNIAFDITGHIYWEALNINNPVDALAKKMLSHFFAGEFSGRKELYERLIEEYGIDGVVLFQHQNCRAISCSAWELREVCSQFGIPYMEISGDCIDPGIYSRAQIHLRMEAFAERFGGFISNSST